MSRDLIEERWLFLLQQESDCNKQAIQITIRCAAILFNSSESEIKGRSIVRNHAWARKACFILMNKTLKMKDKEIEYLLGKSRNSVSQARINLPHTIRQYPEFLEKLNYLERMIHSELKNKIIFLKTEPSNLS